MMYLPGERSARMLASENGRTEVVKCLIEAKSTVNFQTNVNCNSIQFNSKFTS